LRREDDGRTEQQPKDGETVLHCGHKDKEFNPHHFFGFGSELPEVEFSRPDGTRGKSRWMCLCQACFNLYSENPEACIRADATWLGDEPAIEKPITQ
jgi:hypothetical protein